MTDAPTTTPTPDEHVCVVCSRSGTGRGMGYIDKDGERRWTCDDADMCQYRALHSNPTILGSEERR